jgi:hypothetical protein
MDDTSYVFKHYYFVQSHVPPVVTDNNAVIIINKIFRDAMILPPYLHHVRYL